MSRQSYLTAMDFFTADLHLGHKKIIDICNRINPTTGLKFQSIEEMDELLILNLNKVLTPKDTLYIVGDFSKYPQRYLDRIPGHKVLIRGNHDFDLSPDKLKLFSKVVDALEYKGNYAGKPISIYLHHYACRTWNKKHYGAWHLFGHSHGTLPSFDKSFDIGVDSHNFKPLSLSDVGDRMSLL